MANYGLQREDDQPTIKPQKVGEMARRQYEGDDKVDPEDVPMTRSARALGVERSRPDIRLNLENQTNEVVKLRDAIRMLSDRLDPIMLPIDSKDPGTAQDSPSQSHIALMIDSTTDQVSYALRDVENILDRIQLG